MTLNAEELRRYSYFAALPDEALTFLSTRIKPLSIPSGQTIIKEGDLGEAFYFVKQGKVEITKKGRSGNEAIISTVDSGQGFGEMAMLTCSARSCSVHAVTDLELYALPQADFESVMLGSAAFKDEVQRKISDFEQYNRLKTLQPFELMSPEKMHAVMEKMVEQDYAPGQDIIVQGEKGDKYYVIKSGRVDVLKKKRGEDAISHIAELTDGDAFGEEALIRDDPRNATCRAASDTTVLVLNKKDFNDIVKASFLENIFPEDIPIESYMQDYVIIDVRIPPEYAEEHIKGALNIPIEDLRTRCLDFDPKKKYVTYCLNDSRGMVGAFLLKNRGFDAQCLRGGVSGWLGEVVTGSDGVHLPQ